MRSQVVWIALSIILLCQYASSQEILDTVYTPPGYEDGSLIGTVYVPVVPNGVGVILGHAARSTKENMSRWCDSLAAHGYTAMTIDYYDWWTNLSTYPRPIRTFKTAVQFLRRNAIRFKILTGRIVGLGQSEGAIHWGESIIWDNDYGYFKTDSTISDHLDAAILFYGLYDNLNNLDSWANLDSILSAYFVADPTLRETKGNCIANVANITTPVLLIHGTADLAGQYEQSVELHDSLLAHGKTSQLVLGPWGHQFDTYLSPPYNFTPEGLVAKDSVLAFLRRTVPVSVWSHADQFTVDRAYFQPGTDSIVFTAYLMNTLNHICVLSAIVSDGAGMVRDSLRMFDDGTHGDVTAGDSIWACHIRAPMDENMFSVAVRTDDISEGRFVRQPNAVRFTTAGPVVVESIATRRLSPTSESVRVDVWLRNAGKDTTIRSIKAVLRTTDPVVTSFVMNDKGYGDLGPDGVRMATYVFKVDTSVDSADIPFAVEVSSNGIAYWMPETIAQLRPLIGVITWESQIPREYRLHQNYPNPFNPSTTITYELPKSSMVRLSVYDMLGREVSLLVNERRDAGVHEVTFDASGLSSGVYFYRMQAGDFVQSHKLTILK